MLVLTNSGVALDTDPAQAGDPVLDLLLEIATSAFGGAVMGEPVSDAPATLWQDTDLLENQP